MGCGSSSPAAVVEIQPKELDKKVVINDATLPITNHQELPLKPVIPLFPTQISLNSLNISEDENNIVSGVTKALNCNTNIPDDKLETNVVVLPIISAVIPTAHSQSQSSEIISKIVIEPEVPIVSLVYNIFSSIQLTKYTHFIYRI